MGSLRRLSRRLIVAIAVIIAASALVMPHPVSAHSLDSSSIVVTIDEDVIGATVTVAVDTMADALDDPDVATHLGEVADYLDEHLSVVSVDGTNHGRERTGLTVPLPSRTQTTVN